MQGLRHGQRSAPFQKGPQVFALDELEGNEVQVLIFAAVKHPGNGLVVQTSGGAGLLVEPTNVLGIGRHFRRQDFQGHDPIQLRVPCAKDGRHASHPDGLDQLEVGQSTASEDAAEEPFLYGSTRNTARDDRGRTIGRFR